MDRDKLQRLKQRLNNQALEFVRHILPGGYKAGKEYVVGDLDGKGKFSVAIDGDRVGLGNWFLEPGGTKDLIQLYQIATGAKFIDAVNVLEKWVGLLEPCPNSSSSSLAHSRDQPPPAKRKALKRERWTNKLSWNESSLVSLSKNRGIPRDALELAYHCQCLGFMDYGGIPCYVVTDESRTLGEVRRVDGENFQNGAKALTLPGSEGRWLCRPFPNAEDFILTEGSTDFLTAFAAHPNSAIGTFLGSGAVMTLDQVGDVMGRPVCIYAHSDKSGLASAERHQRFLEQASSEVRLFCFEEGDLNDNYAPEPTLRQERDEAEAAEIAGLIDLLEKEVEKPAAPIESCDPPEPEKGGVEMPFPLYFHETKSGGRFLVEVQPGRWQAQTEAMLNRRLRVHGVNTSSPERGMASDADRVLVHVQDHNFVDYAGPVSGRKSGYFECNGSKILCTTGMELPVPSPGDYDTILAVFSGLLGPGVQLNILIAWLHLAVKSIQSGQYQPGQAMAIAGPPGCGKSLVQHLITEIISGRAADAAAFFCGQTNFNGELFQAEHLILEDAHMGTKHADRLALGAAIKNATVSTKVQRCHPKGEQAVNLQPWWRVSITLNEDREALRVLPAMDEHVADKIILLKARRFEMPMPTHTAQLQERFWDQLLSEIPAFVHYLLNDYQIPEEFHEPRYGVITWHEPSLLEELDAMSPERAMLEMMDNNLFDDKSVLHFGPLEVTGSELKEQLCYGTTCATEAKALLGWAGATDQYLHRLSKKMPERVRKTAEGFEIARPDDPFKEEEIF